MSETDVDRDAASAARREATDHAAELNIVIDLDRKFVDSQVVARVATFVAMGLEIHSVGGNLRLEFRSVGLTDGLAVACAVGAALTGDKLDTVVKRVDAFAREMTQSETADLTATSRPGQAEDGPAPGHCVSGRYPRSQAALLIRAADHIDFGR